MQHDGYGPCLFRKVWHVYAEGFFHHRQCCQSHHCPGLDRMFLDQKLMQLLDLVERGPNCPVLLLRIRRHVGLVLAMLAVLELLSLD